MPLRTMIRTDAMLREASRPHNVAAEVVVPTCRPAYDGQHMHMRGQWLRGPPICGQDCSLNLASCASRHSKQQRFDTGPWHFHGMCSDLNDLKRPKNRFGPETRLLRSK